MSVDNNGLVTVASDAAIDIYTITATSTGDDTKSDTSVITVTAPTPVTGITFNHETMSLATGGDPGVITATITPAGATNRNIEWTSSDETVATVNDGIVTPLTAGTTVITAATEDGGHSDTCTVTVRETVDISEILGIAQPLEDGIPASVIIENDQYSGTVSWNPGDNPFEAGVSYTATITLTAKANYTFTGIEEDFFIVEGAVSVTNDADSGTVTAVFAIAVTDETDLDNVRNNLGADYIQVADIDLSGYLSWVPIGGGFDNKFTGSYNGNGKTISNLTIDTTNYYYGTGLFGTVTGTIENVLLNEADISYDTGCIGGLAGILTGGAVIRNCHVDVTLAGSHNSGGLIGRNFGGTIADCSAVGTFNADYSQPNNLNNLGGLVGYNEGSISRCFADVFMNCEKHSFIGGLVGINMPDGEISQSYAVGDVTSDWLGDADCDNRNIGGLIGSNIGNVDECYSAGTVNYTGEQDYMAGGLIGDNMGEVQDCYYDSETSGYISSDGGTPKTTAEMMQEPTFAGWDFDDIWDMDEGITYPYLQWQNAGKK